MRLSAFRARGAPRFEHANGLALPDGVTGGNGAGHGLEAAQQPTPVVNGDHTPVHHTAGETDRTRSRA